MNEWKGREGVVWFSRSAAVRSAPLSKQEKAHPQSREIVMPSETLPTIVIGMIVLETSPSCEIRQNARIYWQPRCVVDARMPRYVKSSGTRR